MSEVRFFDPVGRWLKMHEIRAGMKITSTYYEHPHRLTVIVETEEDDNGERS